MEKVVENKHGVKVGDLFYTSWGYDQTNIEWFQVVGVTAAMATVRPIKGRIVEGGGWKGKSEPVKDEFIVGGYCKDQVRTKTDNWGDGPRLKNADGHDHMGTPYKGRAIEFTSYA